MYYSTCTTTTTTTAWWINETTTKLKWDYRKVKHGLWRHCFYENPFVKVEFNEGCEGCIDNVRPGRPSTSYGDKNIELVRSRVVLDWRMTVRMISWMLENRLCTKFRLENCDWESCVKEEGWIVSFLCKFVSGWS